MIINQESFYLKVSCKTFNNINEIKAIAGQYFGKGFKTEVIKREDKTFSGNSLVDLKFVSTKGKTETYAFYITDDNKYCIV